MSPFAFSFSDRDRAAEFCRKADELSSGRAELLRSREPERRPWTCVAEGDLERLLSLEPLPEAVERGDAEELRRGRTRIPKLEWKEIWAGRLEAAKVTFGV